MRKLFFLLPVLTLISIKNLDQTINQDGLVDLKDVSVSFTYEVRYATTNNFLKTAVYECERCLLQDEVAKSLDLANTYFCEMGYRIRLFDCYRPLSVQKKMWKIYPNPTYVANPYTKKSVHNRGAAVDLTLEDLETGKMLDMGTDYDFFGREAHQDNMSLPKEVLENRKILREGMQKFGFQPIRTEWWHYSYRKNYRYPVMDDPLCD
ncbi:M15 family metallopeptidase [Gangjinia marincola]